MRERAKARSGALRKISEPAGNAVALTHIQGRLERVVDAAGRELTLAYDAAGRLTSLTDPLGRKVTYAYDASGRLSSVVDKIGSAAGQDPNRHKWLYAYDGSSSRLASVTDPDGRVRVQNTYDSEGRLATQKDGLLNTTSFAYASAQTTITDPRGNQTVQLFDPRWRLIEQRNTVGAATYTLLFTYDDRGNLTSATDRNGNRTDYTYDARGNVLTRTDPQLDPQTPRYTTTYEYDAKNNLTRLTDARGFVSTHSYDAVSNVRLSTTQQIDATTSATTKWEYTDSANPGMVTRRIAPRGNTTGTPDYTFSETLRYDASANLAEHVTADGAKTTYTYDAAGRRLTSVDPDGNAAGGLPAEHTWTTAYDENDAVTSETDPLGNVLGFAYDGAGNRTSTTDRRGNVATYVYDNAARLLRVEQKPDPAGATVYQTQLARDANGNVTRVTQANGVVTDYAYDSLNRLTSFTTHPTAGTDLVTSYALDGNGNVTSRTTADSVTTTYTYDALSRLTSVAATGLTTITFAYNETSLRTSMTDGTGTTTYAYDGLGRLTSAAQPNGTLTYAYDLDSNRTSVTYPGAGGGTLTSAYSPGGRLTTLTDWATRATSYTYTAAGRARTLTLPNGLVTTYTHDRAQRLTRIENKVGATVISDHSYTLDPEGNRTALAEFVSGITTPGGTDSFTLTYDGLNRLTAISGPVAESFTFDQASNIASRTGPSATNTYDQANRHTSDGSQSYTWSNADRLTARGADTFGYDALDRLTSSTVAGTSRTYAYSGDGLLQSRTQGASTTSFLWDLGTAPQRLLQVGGDRLVYGLGPLYAIKSDGTALTFARDAQKSIRAETNSSGSVTGSFRYRAYGEVAQSSGSGPTSLGYAGQLIDPSGLVYLRARWYEPHSGRFTTRDPFPGDVVLPISLNAYGYAHANPSLLDDPTGTCAGWLALVCAVGQWAAQQVARLGPAIQRWVLRTERVVERAEPLLERVPRSVQLSEKALEHVVQSHTAGGANAAGKSIFFMAEEVPTLIQRAASVTPRVQAGGRTLQWVVEAAQEVGIERATGFATRTYTVITDLEGRLITAFPGLP